tara:strand:+ start:636 stop:1292 length:657 start_codon:yes stop_codon:yes gene_type:complete
MTIQIIKLSSEVKNIFFDFDGVIIDSNKFKENAIEESIALYCNDKFKADKALAYFNKNAGVGRRKKLLKFFDSHIVNKIMTKYSILCNSFYMNTKPTNGSISLLKDLRLNFPSLHLYILSGGEKDEIKNFIFYNNMENLFNDFLCSEKSKSKHLYEKMNSEMDIFLGDSITDLNVATKHKIKFILVQKFKSELSCPPNLKIGYATKIVKDLESIRFIK